MKKFQEFDIVKHVNGGSRYVVTGFVGHGTGVVKCKDVMTGAVIEYRYTVLRKVA